MRDQFTEKLNELLAETEVDSGSRPQRMGAVFECVLANRIECESRTRIAAPGNNSPYEVWTESDEEHSLRTRFAEARRMIAEASPDRRALAKLRRVICKSLHPDVVPRKFSGDAEEIMKTLNSLISSARQQY